MSNMVIQTNVMALNSHRNLKTVGTKQSQASSRLSSGYRINSAADDAAGLAISEKMRSQIRGLDMASKNAQDGVSLVQTAEGGMQEIDNMLQRIRELVVQASNDTNENNSQGTGDRQKIQDEINQLVAEIDSMAERVEFNKKKLINGDALGDTAKNEKINNINKQLIDLLGNASNAASAAAGAGSVSGGEIGKAFDKATGASDIASVSEITAEVTGLSYATDTDTASNTITTATLTTSDTITKGTLDSISADLAASNVTDRAKVDAKIAEIDKYISDYEAISGTSMSDADKKALREIQANLAKAYQATSTVDTLNSSKTAINALTTGSELYLQVGANAFQGFDVSIASIKSDILGIGDGMGHASINLLEDTGKDITGLLNTLDNALSFVTTERSKLGAVQNRLEYTMKSLDISSENLSASESRIRDADMAKEMMKLTQANVLQQAATAMLAQANQAPQSVLQLLQ